MWDLLGGGFISDTPSPTRAWMDNYIPLEDQPVVTAAIDASIRAKSTFELEHRVLRPDGSIGWTFSRAVPILNDEGEIREWFGTATDITTRRLAEEHQRILIGELNHRVRNTLATVQSIVAQSLRNSSDPQEAQAAVESRLLALSRVHDVLTRESWEGAWIGDVVSNAIKPFLSGSETRFHCRGSEIRLPPRTALALAMAFQELATNAVKYGALSNETGELHLSWLIDHTGSEPFLFLRWEENGGPPVRPPSRRGFGSRLIERSLAQELGGKVTINFAPAGVVCTVEAPLEVHHAVQSPEPDPYAI